MRWTVPARVVLMVAVAAGCSSSSDEAVTPGTVAVPASSTTEPSTSSTATPSTATPSTTAAGPGRCRTSQLQARLLPRQGAAGTSFLPIELRNVSRSACTLGGYPGVTFQNQESASPTGDPPARDPDLPPGATTNPVRVEPGRSAQFVVAFDNIEPPDGPPCPDVSRIAITPPDETDRLVVAVTELLAPCGNERVGPVTPPQPS